MKMETPFDWLHEACVFLQESNRIEGIDIPVTHYMLGFVDQGVRTIPDAQHIFNSAAAMDYVYKNYNRPIKRFDVLRLHYLQTQGLLQDDDCGTIRRSPVYITSGYNIVYTPPEHERVLPLLEAWCESTQRIEGAPCKMPDARLLRLHYEFEAIHPFVDGNGRVGRLLWLWTHLKSGGCVTSFLRYNYCVLGWMAEEQHVLPRALFNELRGDYYKALQKHHTCNKNPAKSAANGN